MQRASDDGKNPIESTPTDSGQRLFELMEKVIWEAATKAEQGEFQDLSPTSGMRPLTWVSISATNWKAISSKRITSCIKLLFRYSVQRSGTK
jgi:hypothetical protein